MSFNWDVILTTLEQHAEKKCSIFWIYGQVVVKLRQQKKNTGNTRAAQGLLALQTRDSP
jgi:hypothetical protein